MVNLIVQAPTVRYRAGDAPGESTPGSDKSHDGAAVRRRSSGSGPTGGGAASGSGPAVPARRRDDRDHAAAVTFVVRGTGLKVRATATAASPTANEPM